MHMRSGLGVALIVSVLACGGRDTTAPDSWEYSVHVDPSSFRVGDTVTVTVVVTNQGIYSRSIDTGLCPPRFTVRTPSDEIVAPGYRICSGLYSPKTLEAGGRHTFSYLWNGDALGAAPAVIGVLSPGTYYVYPVSHGEKASGLGVPAAISVLR